MKLFASPIEYTGIHIEWEVVRVVHVPQGHNTNITAMLELYTVRWILNLQSQTLMLGH